MGLKGKQKLQSLSLLSRICKGYRAIKLYLKTPKENRNLFHVLKLCSEIFNVRSRGSPENGTKKCTKDEQLQDFDNKSEGNDKVSKPQSLKKNSYEHKTEVKNENDSDEIIPIGKKVRVRNMKTMYWDQVGWVLKREDDDFASKYNIQIIDYDDADIDGSKIWCNRSMIRRYKTNESTASFVSSKDSNLPTSYGLEKKRVTTITFREDLNDVQIFNPESPGRKAQFENKSSKITRELKMLMSESSTNNSRLNKDVKEKRKRSRNASNNNADLPSKIDGDMVEHDKLKKSLERRKFA